MIFTLPSPNCIHNNSCHQTTVTTTRTFSTRIRWSFLKLASTRRLWTLCCTRQCRCLTTPYWRPLAEATTTAALTVRRRSAPEELSSESESAASTWRGTARTTTGHWDTEPEAWTHFSFSYWWWTYKSGVCWCSLVSILKFFKYLIVSTTF